MINSPPLVLAIAVVAIVAASPTGAQELPLKRQVAGVDAFHCPATGRAVRPGPEERGQAAELGSSATQAVILGDRERARALLERAIELDPTAAELAYQYARVLEEMEREPEALAHYCRVLDLGSDGSETEDARERIDQLSSTARPRFPPDAVATFRIGVTNADQGRLETAVASFDRAIAAVPDWAEAVYDRGVVLARLGRRDGAMTDLQRYLELRPDAADAADVSRRITELREVPVPSALPSPGAALTLGILLPGMGHFYSGRALGGMTVLSIVGGSIAAGLLIEDVEVTCLSEPEPGEPCPEGHAVGREVQRPYLAPALGVAATVSIIGALEAFLRLRDRRAAENGMFSARIAGRRVGALDLTASGHRVDLHLARLSF